MSPVEAFQCIVYISVALNPYIALFHSLHRHPPPELCIVSKVKFCTHLMIAPHSITPAPAPGNHSPLCFKLQIPFFYWL